MKTEANDNIILSKETMDDDDGSITIDLEMPQETLDFLKDMAKKENISIDELVNNMIREYIKDKECQEHTKTS